MRHLVALVAAFASVGALLVGPAGPAGAADPGFAAERLNRGRYTAGTVPTPGTSAPAVELTANGVFHVYPGGSVWSHRFGGNGAWIEAPTSWGPVALGASGTGDYVVGVTSSVVGGDVTARVRTVSLEATTPSAASTVGVPHVAGAAHSVRAAAAGDHVYVAIAQGLGAGERRTTLVASHDRGVTWSAPVDLLTLAGLDATGPRTGVALEAEGNVLAVALGTDRVLVSGDAGSGFAPVVTVADHADQRGPLAVATDGASVRVAWLRRAGGTVSLRSGIVGTDSLLGVGAVPTAPSPLADGVDTEITLARLGSTYALQVDGGRLVSLDPDGAWRWPLPFEPTDTYDDCAPSCPAVLPAAVYGDRLVHRRLGYFSYWYVDRTPSHLVVLEGAPVIDRGRRILVRVDDDGELSDVTCQLDNGPVYEAFSYPWYCYVNGTRRSGRHILTVRATDLSGNVTVLRHTWIVDGSRPTVRIARTTPVFSTGDARWSWRASDDTGVVGMRAAVVRTNRQVGSASRTVALPASRRAHAVRVRPGESVCLRVRATDVVGHAEETTSCAFGMSDEDLLDGPVRAVRGRAYVGGTAALLPADGSVRTGPAHRGLFNTWGVRVLTCPTCGTLRISGLARPRSVDLHASRPRLRVVRLSSARTGSGYLFLAATGRVVVDGYWRGYLPRER